MRREVHKVKGQGGKLANSKTILVAKKTRRRFKFPASKIRKLGRRLQYEVLYEAIAGCSEDDCSDGATVTCCLLHFCALWGKKVLSFGNSTE
jgi:hypothetical protein